MPVWVRFPVLPVECYTTRWLKQAGNHIGRTVRVDFATLLATRGKFARVCVEVDLDKPLMAGYRMGGDYYMLQYEGLTDLCFGCGRYGHRMHLCPEKATFSAATGNGASDEGNRAEAMPQGNHAGPRAGDGKSPSTTEEAGEGHGEWSIVQRNRRRSTKEVRGNTGNSLPRTDPNVSGADSGKSKQNPTDRGAESEKSKQNHPTNTAGGGPKKVLGNQAATTEGIVASNGASGSRFSGLAVNIEDENGNEEDTEMDINVTQGADRVQSNAGVDGRGKTTSVEEIEAMEGVELAASDPSLLDGVRTQSVSKLGPKPKQAQNSNNKKKNGAMKDVTNILEAQPVKLKPDWTGSKSGRGPRVKIVGPATSWTKHGNQNAQTDGRGGNNNNFNVHGAQYHCAHPTRLEGIRIQNP